MHYLNVFYYVFIWSFCIYQIDLKNYENNKEKRTEQQRILEAMICTVLEILNWNNVVIFYETTADQILLQNILIICCRPTSGFMVTEYHLSQTNRSELRRILIEEYIKASQEVHMILMLGSETMNLLEEANGVDMISNKTTNYVTNSKWIIIYENETLLRHVSGFRLRNRLLLGSFDGCVHLHTLGNDKLFGLNCLEYNQQSNYFNSSTCSARDLFPNSAFKFNSHHLNIGVIDSTSFFEIESSSQMGTVYKGIVVELVTILSNALNFTYTFVQPPERSWGVVDANGEWNGLIKDLLDHKTDMIIADLTVTKERSEVVDFIFPSILLQDLGILYRKGIQEPESDWIRIFGPLHADVYGLTFAGIAFVGCLLLILDGTAHNITSRVSIDSVTSLVLSLIGVITLQGNGLRPRSASSKILVAAFWMFCIVITGTYIGNLTARMAATKIIKPFSTLEELVKLSDWTWGVGGELTTEMIRLDNSAVMKALWKGLVELNKTETGVTDFNNTLQLGRVSDTSRKYAYIVLDARHFMYNQKGCDFELADNVMTSLPTAIAVHKNSYLKPKIEKIMWTLFNSGVLQKLDEIHYRDNRPTNCSVVPGPRSVRIQDLFGAILVIMFGLTLSLIVLVLETGLRRINRKLFSANIS